MDTLRKLFRFHLGTEDMPLRFDIILLCIHFTFPRKRKQPKHVAEKINFTNDSTFTNCMHRLQISPPYSGNALMLPAKHKVPGFKRMDKREVQLRDVLLTSKGKFQISQETKNASSPSSFLKRLLFTQIPILPCHPHATATTKTLLVPIDIGREAKANEEHFLPSNILLKKHLITRAVTNKFFTSPLLTPSGIQTNRKFRDPA